MKTIISRIAGSRVVGKAVVGMATGVGIFGLLGSLASTPVFAGNDLPWETGGRQSSNFYQYGSIGPAFFQHPIADVGWGGGVEFGLGYRLNDYVQFEGSVELAAGALSASNGVDVTVITGGIGGTARVSLPLEQNPNIVPYVRMGPELFITHADANGVVAIDDTELNLGFMGGLGVDWYRDNSPGAIKFDYTVYGRQDLATHKFGVGWVRDF